MPAKSSGGSSAAQLNYVIAARDAQFQRVVTRVTKRLERLEQGGRKTTKSIGGLSAALKRFPGIPAALGAVAGALSLARLNQELTESISRLERLGKRARNIDLPVETLQLWTQAAKEAGVEANAFQRGLFQVNKVLAEAGTGSKEYLDIFTRLGITVRDASGELRPMQSILLEVTRELKTLDVATQQLTIEELFGRAGKEMRAFLLDFQTQVAGVEAGFRGTSAEAVKLAEELQNMRDRGLGNMTAALDEALVRMDRLLSLSKSITDFWNRTAEAIRFAVLHGPFSDDPRTRMSVPLPRQDGQPPPRRVESDQYTTVIAGARRPDRFHPGNLPSHLRFREEPPVDRSAGTPPAGRSLGTSPTDLRRRQTSELFARILARQERKRQQQILETQNLENRLAAARRASYLDEQDRLQVLTHQRETAARRQRLLERLQYDRARKNLGEIIGDFVRRVGTVSDALTGLLDSLSNAIIDSFADKAAEALLSSAGGGLLTSLLGGGGSAGFLSSLFGSQRGGSVQRGRAILVGEGGPEVFVPRTSGHIIPNSAASASMGGSTVNLVFNIESTDGPGVRAAIRESEPRLTAAALSAIAVQQGRPGSILGRQNRQAP